MRVARKPMALPSRLSLHVIPHTHTHPTPHPYRVGLVRTPPNVHHVTAVPPVHVRRRVLYDTWEVQQTNPAQVVRCEHVAARGGGMQRIDVGAVTVWEPDAHDGKAQQATPARPGSVSLVVLELPTRVRVKI